MKALLRLSGVIDAISRLFGRIIIWLVLAATLISATNAIARKLFNIGSNAILEIQWYLFAAVFLRGDNRPLEFAFSLFDGKALSLHSGSNGLFGGVVGKVELAAEVLLEKLVHAGSLSCVGCLRVGLVWVCVFC